MQCVKCQVPLASLGMEVLAIKLGYCPKCGLVYAQKSPIVNKPATAPSQGQKPGRYNRR